MGDRHDGAGVLLQELLEPVDALGVEVVRRLVEQQQVGAAEQQAAQGDAAALTARQRRHVGVVGRAAQGVHGDLDVALEAPRVGRGDLVLELGLLGADLVVVGVGLGPHRHDLVVAVDDRLHRGDAVHDVALDVLGRVELRLLGEVAGREPGREAGRPAEAVVEAGHDLEQARLAGPVGPDDPDLGARVERDRDVLQHRAIGRVEAGQLVAGVDELVRHDGVRGYPRASTDSSVCSPGRDAHTLPAVDVEGGRRRGLGRGTLALIVVGVVLTNLTMVSVWSWRTFASSQGFADATTDMLKEPAVREVVAEQIVDALEQQETTLARRRSPHGRSSSRSSPTSWRRRRSRACSTPACASCTRPSSRVGGSRLHRARRRHGAARAGRPRAWSTRSSRRRSPTAP